MNTYLKILLFICFIILTTACGGAPTDMYIDINKEAIVDCKNLGFKNLIIRTDSTEITLEGTLPILYFNKKNLIARTTILGTPVYDDYILKLKPNAEYTLIRKAGYDQGPFVVTFQTDNKAKIKSASRTKCGQTF